MTSLGSEKWEVTPFHFWSVAAWGLSVAVLLLGVALHEERLAWVALFGSAGSATYNICATIKAGAMGHREAFDMGRELEARRQAESGVERIR